MSAPQRAKNRANIPEALAKGKRGPSLEDPHQLAAVKLGPESCPDSK
jgi:hypothetical protein